MNDEIKEILEYLKDDSNWYRINNEEECIVEPYKLLLPNQRNSLLDYITNLQQENYELKYINYGDNKITIEDCINEMNNIINNLQQENERLKEENKHIFANVNDDELLINNAMNYAEAQDYKSRCEKASEKLGNYKHYSTPTEEQNSENENIVDSALNILQNRSDEK